MKNAPFSPDLTPTEVRWGTRYLFFELVFLGPILTLLLGLFFPGIATSVLNFLYFLINFIVVLWLFRRFLMNSLKKIKGNVQNFLLAILAGFTVYELMSLGLGMLIEQCFPNFFNVNDAALSISTRENVILMSIGTVILVPIVEETLHRGLVFGLFRSRSRWLGYTVSTLVFCAIHVAGYVGSFSPLQLLICFIQYIPAGLVLAWAYEFSGSIFAPTVIHMAVNAIGILSMR